MGNRPSLSSSVTRLEYTIHIQKIERELSKMQKNFNDSFSEILRKQKLLATDMERIQGLLNEKEQLFDIVEENLAQVQSVTQSVELEARKTKEEIGQKMREAISKEKLKIDADIDEIKMRNTYLKDNVMELTTLDLAHERQLRDLLKRVSILENTQQPKKNRIQHIQNKQKSSDAIPLQVSTENVTPDLTHAQSKELKTRKKSSFGSNFDKIDAAIRKLKEDIKKAEIRNQQ